MAGGQAYGSGGRIGSHIKVSLILCSLSNVTQIPYLRLCLGHAEHPWNRHGPSKLDALDTHP